MRDMVRQLKAKLDEIKKTLGEHDHRRGERGRRRGHPAGHLRHDGHPPRAHRAEREREAAAHRGGAAQEGDRPGRGHLGHRLGHPPLAHGPVLGPPAPGLLRLPRPHGRRQDPRGQDPRRVPLRRRGGPGPHRHVGLHGEAQRVAPGRGAPGVRRLRGGRPAHREDPPPALQRDPARRDREGAPRRVQHAAAGPGGGAALRQPRPRRLLPQRRPHHDLEPRRPRDQQGQLPRLPVRGGAG